MPGFAFPSPHIPVQPPIAPGYFPPVQQARAYPYYGPPPREPDFDVPANAARYQKPLPLPGGAVNAKTPTQAQPQPPVAPPAIAHEQAPVHRKPSVSAEERDRLLAIAFEQQEEERRKKAREQEELDMELARKLDLELNLEADGAGSGPHAIPQNAEDAMPGSWYRHRPSVS